jgi:NADH:ubiquinone oxidoreductase subunit 2 (subunit N)
MIGFFSKLFILLNLIELKMYFFALFLIILNSIGVIYYLRFIKVMYFANSNKFLSFINISEIKALFLIVLAYLNIFFFFYPTHIILLIHNFILLFI